MKNRFLLALASMFIFASQVLCQDVSFPDISTITPQNLFQSTVEPLFGLLVILFGYLSAYIPGVNKWQPFYRVAAFALAVGLGFHLFGASVWKLAFTYFMSSGLYAVILQNILKSPKAVTSPAEKPWQLLP